MKHLKQNGFSLLELMAVVAIIGILASIAIPQYTGYIARSRITEAVSALSDMRVRMEQYFQDNRTYVGACQAGTLAPLPTNTPTFQYTCPTITTNAYTVQASGIGSMTSFGYSIDQNNARVTTSLPPGWSGQGNTCWVLKSSGSC